MKNINSPVCQIKVSGGIIADSFSIQINSSQDEQIPLRLHSLPTEQNHKFPQIPPINLWSFGVKKQHHTTCEGRGEQVKIEESRGQMMVEDLLAHF